MTMHTSKSSSTRSMRVMITGFRTMGAHSPAQNGRDCRSVPVAGGASMIVLDKIPRWPVVIYLQFTWHSTEEIVGGTATVLTLISCSPRRQRKSHWMPSAFEHEARSGKQVASVLLSHFPASGSDAGPYPSASR